MNPAPTLPIADLVVDVFESSPPPDRARLLNQLIGRAYATAPTPVRQSLLEKLLRPLGPLGLVSVAGGLFATLRFRDGWANLSVQPEDVQRISPSDVIALADYVQQVSWSAMLEAARVVAASPAMAGSGVAAVLTTLLIHQSIDRRRIKRD
jgi:hypothetical protein